MLLAVPVAVLAVRSALLAAEDLALARRELVAARDAEDDLARLQEPLDRAQDLVGRADRQLSSPAVRIVAALPLVGRSLAAERAVADVVDSALAGTAAVVEAGPSLRTAGGIDLTRLRALTDRLEPLAEQAAADLQALRDTSTGLTPAAVPRAVREVDQTVSPLVETLQRASQGAELAFGLLGGGGPRPLLFALQNNAELRGTGGYVSSVAPGVAADGRLALDRFVDVVDVADPPGATRTVPAPAEFVEDYGPFLADTTLWREWTMSPDVPDAASVTAEVARELLGRQPDVVVLLDVPALAGILGVADRPVRLPDGSTVEPDALADALLVGTYARAGSDLDDQEARRAALQAAAGATVAELLQSDLPVLPLVRELGRLAAGRHLALWSADVQEQAALEALGLAGSADPEGDDLALVSVNNLNANKLDVYVERRVTVEATVGADSAEVVQRVTLENRAPADLVPYVAGIQTPGTVRERLELSISPQARFTSLRKDGSLTTGDVRSGQERTRVHTFVELARGQRVEVVLRYSVPVDEGRYRLRLLPQPLAEDAQLDVVVRPAPGHVLEQVAGADQVDGRAVRTGPWARTELVEVRTSPAVLS